MFFLKFIFNQNTDYQMIVFQKFQKILKIWLLPCYFMSYPHQYNALKFLFYKAFL